MRAHWAQTGWINVVSTSVQLNDVEPMWNRCWIDICAQWGMAFVLHSVTSMTRHVKRPLLDMGVVSTDQVCEHQTIIYFSIYSLYILFIVYILFWYILFVVVSTISSGKIVGSPVWIGLVFKCIKRISGFGPARVHASLTHHGLSVSTF